MVHKGLNPYTMSSKEEYVRSGSTREVTNLVRGD